MFRNGELQMDLHYRLLGVWEVALALLENSGEMENNEKSRVLSQAASTMDFKTYFAVEGLINSRSPNKFDHT